MDILVLVVLLVDIEVCHRTTRVFQGDDGHDVFSCTGADWYAGMKLSPAGVINVAYFHQKTNSPLQLGVEFESSLAVKETSATFSYQYDLQKANATFRGKFSSFNFDRNSFILLFRHG